MSSVVEASAGTGKTWTLVSRIIRLLLEGAQPGEILALSFTRLAAREMEERLVEWLTWLATKPESEVIQFLKDRGLPHEKAEQLIPGARLLLEQWLLASPPITLCTYDVWYQKLLAAAPLASSIPRDYAVEQDNEILVEEAWQQLLERHPDTETTVGASLEWLLRREKLFNLNGLLTSFARQRTEWRIYTENQSNPVDFAVAELETLLGAREGDNPNRELADNTKVNQWVMELARHLGAGSDALKKVAGNLDAAQVGSTPIESLHGVLFTQAGTPRSNIEKSVAKSDQINLIESYKSLMESIDLYRNILSSIESIEFNRHALTVAHAWLEELLSLKRQRREADHGDIHFAVRQLLQDPDQAAHLLCRLDSRYRHILLDEFQDTSPLQWQILEKWLETSAEGGTPPTVMMVGDPKQSIYRFRKAHVRLFKQAGEFLERTQNAQRVTLNRSWRSGEAIIDVVNEAFSQAYDDFPRHLANPEITLSQVHPLALELAPPQARIAAPLELRNPLVTPRQTHEDDSEQENARHFAQKVQEMVTTWEVEDTPGGPRRPAHYGDILVLSRQRKFMRPYRDALREAGIPFLIEQRGELLESLEISDLRALLQVLTDPYDSLSLAHCLRSPIFGLTDLELISLAGKTPWWETLAHSPNPHFQEIAKTLIQWRDWSRTLPVHDCLERILAQGQIRERYLAAAPTALKLSVQANLQAFLALSLELGSGRYPSLPRFLQELEDQEDSAVDAPDEGRLGELQQGVRFLTIHGAKGLEAPIVCLIDPSASTSNSDSQRRWLVRWDPDSAGPEHFSLLPSKSARAKGHEQLVAAEEQEKEQEDKNLLYVALTRARNHLVILGSEKSPWTQRLRQTLEFEALVAGTHQD
jgi:ATP-dependent helicase/nuclease subunit A